MKMGGGSLVVNDWLVSDDDWLVVAMVGIR
jgi:hypothetical protein